MGICEKKEKKKSKKSKKSKDFWKSKSYLVPYRYSSLSQRMEFVAQSSEQNASLAYIEEAVHCVFLSLYWADVLSDMQAASVTVLLYYPRFGSRQK